MFTFLENLESGILRSLVFKSSYRKTMKVRTLITIVTDSTGRKKKQKADQNKNYSGNLNLENWSTQFSTNRNESARQRACKEDKH